MDCIKPITAWRCGSVRCKSDGQISPNLVFSYKEALRWFSSRFGAAAYYMIEQAEVTLPCGKCPNCLSRKRKEQSVRLIHEKSLYDNACFITLTYDENNVPCTDTLSLDNPRKVFSRGDALPVKTLLPDDVTKFLKRLRRRLTYQLKRKKCVRDYVDRIRYFAVGEYGGKTGRPHYHIIIFNWFPSDAVHRQGHDFTSKQIAELWPFGFHLVSRVVDSSCRYCAQYVTKKLVKSSSPLDCCRFPEYCRQSTKNGGIGVPWFFKNHDFCSKVGYCTFRSDGVVYKSGLPKSYIRCLRKYFPDKWLKWRDMAMSRVASNSMSAAVVLARCAKNLVNFRKSLERGVL